MLWANYRLIRVRGLDRCHVLQDRSLSVTKFRRLLPTQWQFLVREQRTPPLKLECLFSPLLPQVVASCRRGGENIRPSVTRAVVENGVVPIPHAEHLQSKTQSLYWSNHTIADQIKRTANTHRVPDQELWEKMFSQKFITIEDCNCWYF